MIDPPAGYTWKSHRSSRTRDAWIVTAPNGTRVSFYEDGGIRVYRPEHDVEIATAHRSESGTNVNIEFLRRS